MVENAWFKKQSADKGIGKIITNAYLSGDREVWDDYNRTVNFFLK